MDLESKYCYFYHSWDFVPYEMALKSDNVEFVRYCGGHFENGDR
jgi:hypothetical protein